MNRFWNCKNCGTSNNVHSSKCKTCNYPKEWKGVIFIPLKAKPFESAKFESIVQHRIKEGELNFGKKTNRNGKKI